VNADGSQYDYVVSERLGRTTSKEQYAYIYNTQTIEVINTPHTYPEPDSTDLFHREPYIASFKAFGGNFDATFTVTDPGLLRKVRAIEADALELCCCG